MARKKTLKAKKPRHRSAWQGMLRFGLVSFPVQAFNAHLPEENAIGFHLLHKECHRRIHYDKQCPVHGHVDNDDIVSGYEYAKGKYIEVESEELEAAKTQKERSLTLDAFIAPDELDPLYFDGRMYYLAPQGEDAREPYAIFLEALKRTDRYGVGQVVFSGKEQAALIRPYEDALHMAMLNYVPEIREPEAVVGALPKLAAGDKKVRLAERLIESWGDDDFDFSKYEDHYLKKVRELIEQKVKGHEIVAPEEEEEPEVINLMEALEKSVARGHSRGRTAHAARRKANGHRTKRSGRTRRKRAS
jgi:DNA end-binding protein Ku